MAKAGPHRGRLRKILLLIQRRLQGCLVSSAFHNLGSWICEGFPSTSLHIFVGFQSTCLLIKKLKMFYTHYRSYVECVFVIVSLTHIGSTAMELIIHLGRAGSARSGMVRKCAISRHSCQTNSRTHRMFDHL